MKKRIIYSSLVIAMFLLSLIYPMNIKVKAAVDKTYYQGYVNGGGGYKTYTEISANWFFSMKQQYKAISWGRPFNCEIYEDKGLIVYGEPHGEWKDVAGGYCRNGSRVGEYRYLGYTVDGSELSNSAFPTDDESSNTNLATRNWIRYPWNDPEIRSQFGVSSNYATIYNSLKTKIGDVLNSIPDFRESNYGKTVSDTGKAGGIGVLDWGIFQSGLGDSRGSFRMFHKTSSGKYYYMTFEGIIQKKNYPPLKVTVTPEKTSYVMKKDEDQVKIKITVTGTLQDNYSILDAVDQIVNYTRNDVQSYALSLAGKNIDGREYAPTNKINNSNNIEFTRTFTLTLYRKDLQDGNNTLTYTGKAIVRFPNSNINATAPTTINVNINVEGKEPGEPSITAQADPTNAKTGGTVTVKVKVNGEVNGYSGSPKITKLTLRAKRQEDTTWQTYDKTGENTSVSNTFTFNINTNDNEFTQYFNCEFIVTYADNTTKKKSVDVSTVFIKDNPPPPQETNTPPKAYISAPSYVVMGDDVYISGGGTDAEDGLNVSTSWGVFPSTYNGTLSDNGGYVYFSSTGLYSVGITVADSKGLTDSAYTNITVVPPYPNIYFKTTGTLKENRKVTIDASSSNGGSSRYPINWTSAVWQITPLSDGLTQNDIKVVQSLNGSQKLDMLFKKAGRYYVKLTVTNTAGYSSSKDMVLDIKPDDKPLADFNIIKTVIRDPATGTATISIQDSSYSPDGDIIAKRVWFYAYDSDNDGDFDEETWYVLNNGAWQAIGKYNDIKT